jgi:hypothetical protein
MISSACLRSRWTKILLVHGLESRSQNREGSRQESGDETIRLRRRPHRVAGLLQREPVAWCSIAPRTTYRDLGGPTNISELPEEVWSLACFFIRRELRGKGLTNGLSRLWCGTPRSAAKVVEAYPVEPGSPSYRFMGYLSTFSAAGFHEVGRAGTRRRVMWRELRK